MKDFYILFREIFQQKGFQCESHSEAELKPNDCFAFAYCATLGDKAGLTAVSDQRNPHEQNSGWALTASSGDRRSGKEHHATTVKGNIKA